MCFLFWLVIFFFFHSCDLTVVNSSPRSWLYFFSSIHVIDLTVVNSSPRSRLPLPVYCSMHVINTVTVIIKSPRAGLL